MVGSYHKDDGIEIEDFEDETVDVDTIEPKRKRQVLNCLERERERERERGGGYFSKCNSWLSSWKLCHICFGEKRKLNKNLSADLILGLSADFTVGCSIFIPACWPNKHQVYLRGVLLSVCSHAWKLCKSFSKIFDQIVKKYVILQHIEMFRIHTGIDLHWSIHCVFPLRWGPLFGGNHDHGARDRHIYIKTYSSMTVIKCWICKRWQLNYSMQNMCHNNKYLYCLYTEQPTNNIS